MENKNRYFVNLGLHILGFILCIVPPAACTLSYFPIWVSDGERCLSGGVALLLILSLAPLMKLISRKLRGASSWFIWLLIFLLFFSLSRIAEEMTVISFVGLIGNLSGGLLMRLSRRMRSGANEK